MALLRFVMCLAALIRQSAAKGCFIKTSYVLMADGSSRELQHVQPGDEVTSWDDARKQAVTSKVQALTVVERSAADMIEITLSSRGIIHATVDHPFWSKSRQSLVSMHPERTMEEYKLETSLLNTQDVLENELQQPVQIAGIRHNVSSLFAHPNLVVMTLCLLPHHWFYVEGVRVHNKGCFVPWTPVLMKGGLQKPIGEVQINETVLSWDMATDQAVHADVIGIDIFPAKDLMELAYNFSSIEASDLLGISAHAKMQAPDWNSHSLVLTKDHPIYSAGQQQLVSMSPNVTKELYGLSVGQLQATDTLRHHSGQHVHAGFWPWNGNATHVVTLRLADHHWFYANGVLVHNKGGGGGGKSSGSYGSSGSGASSVKTTTHTRASMGSRGYVGFIFIGGGSRRRYGRYKDEPGSKCIMADELTVNSSCQTIIYQKSKTGLSSTRDADCKLVAPGAVTPQASTSCNAGSTSQVIDITSCDCCHRCMACETVECTDGIEGCEDFIATAFPQCTEEDDEGGSMAWLGIVAAICAGGCLISACAYFGYKFAKSKIGAKSGCKEMQDKTTQRANMVPNNSRGDLTLQLHGTYSENGETKPTSYNMTINSLGRVSGFAQDDDDQSAVTGILNWPAGQPFGRMMWQEKGPSITLEAEGSITLTENAYAIQAQYISNYQNTSGHIAVQSAAMAVVAATVVQGMVVGQPAVGLPGQPKTNGAA